MGVPKFFRYISERYPCLSEVVKDYQIPEFDNMYLDMNGIIHNCSHPDDNNPHFRIAEEKIFKDIFHYLEVLFRMIRPRKLFFMAIDGVAPRAKMNQQRGRRFRSVKDAIRQEEEALKRGEMLPSDARFDSNCITPGTVFMARLHEQLKYFVVDKISNDPLWQNVAVILSGHETPGEGEHKIMDYIRYVKAQPGYDPNTRHCLYGLDADLIMLGLCTHEPHFSLLREEVKFGKKSTKRESVPEEITFFLLHLSLMREYLELEFQPMKDKLVGFEYDFEKVIDDWVLMGFLVGNDFIPPLPNLHITNGALPIIYKAYMEVLPTLDGYINEAGTLKLARFEKFMQQLANFDLENFEEIRDDLLYMEVKTGRKYNAFFNVSSGKDLEKWASEDVDQDLVFECLEPKQNTNQIDSGLAALIKETEEMCLEDSDSQADDEGDDVAFENYKKEYYKNKLEYAKVTPEVMRDQAEGYVRAIQWNLNYYYNGVCSWSWYYPHHYAPYISDIKGFSNLKIEFDLGTPFKPYEQLLAVLPTASKTLLPSTYHHLMTSDESPIKKYYPDNFQTDLNGKKQEWEAVVLIPFMDENLLLDAMKKCNEKLTPEEQKMNTHGPMLMYNYTDEYLDSYEAPAYFPSVRHNHARVVPISIDDIRVPSEKLIKGIYPGAAFDIYYPGFPTMKHLQYKGELHKAKVKVFEQPSRYENMILKIVSNVKYDDNMPINLLGSTVFVAWPHLIEARIVAISNEQRKYIWIGDKNQYNTEDYDNKNHFKAIYGGIVERYKTRLGVEVGTVEIICHVQEMIGRKYLFGANGRLSLEKQFSECTSAYPLQTVVSNISVFDQHHSTLRDVLDVFPEGEICFTLCNPYYGSEGIVLDSKEAIKGGRIKICISVTSEPDFTEVKRKHTDINRKYRLLSVAASQLGMSHYLYSRITGSLYVMVPDGEGGWKNVNVGLDLKFTKKNRETPGYTKKISNVWYYSERCTELVREYAEQFPKIFQYFSQNENADVTAEVIFGDDWDIKIKELQDWLKNLSTHGIEKRTSGSHFMESEVVNEIEYTVDNYLKTTDFKSVTMQVKPNLLYKPELQSGNLSPDNKMVVELFDRIVNIRKGFTVPFGLKGTVILKSETSPKNELDIMYDIVFDKPFKDGMTLNYCSAERGYRLPKSAFINISYGIRLLEKKTGKQESLMSKALKHQNVWQSSDSENLVNETKPNDSAYRARFQSSGFIKRGSAFASFNNQQATPKKIYQKPQQRKSIDLAQYKKSKNNQKPNEDCLKQLSSKPVQDAEDFPMKTIMIKPETTTEYKTRGSVNTAFLKNLLRIDPPNSENAAFLKSEIKENKPKQTQFSSDSTSNVSFEMLAEVAKKAPASVKLLTYYQSNNLGTPRYQYFQTHGMFKAQITLPNKELVVGDSAQNKEEATENVAAIVLEVLIKKAKGKDFSPKGPDENLPVPPKTWVKPLKEPVSTNEKVSRRPDQALKTALHNPFIPTQVIKRQTSRSSDDLVQDVYSCTSFINKKSHMVKSISKNNKMKQELEGLNRHNDRTKRSRRSRIAANFASIEQN